MNGTETRPTGGSTPSSEGLSHIHNGGEGGSSRAEVHDRTGLLVAILALFVSGIAIATAVMGYMSNRDETARIRDELIQRDTEMKDLQIQLDEYVKR